MIPNDKNGALTGYEPMKNITLVRNPNWDPKTDYRPAYLDKIIVKEGVDPDVGSRQIVDGQSQVNGDFTPPPAILKEVATSKKDQLLLIDSGGGRFMSFNFKVPPFNDINVRKAVIAGMDRNALRLTRGGEVIGPIMQHQIPPGLPGFDEAGGQNPPPGADWLQHPTGDKTVMAKYFKAAGMSSGKFEGNEKILVVGDDSGVGGRAAEVAASQLQDMGFKRELPPGPALDHVHEVLQRAQGGGCVLPEHRVVQGLLRLPDAPGPDVQRREHPPGEQLELAADE